MIPGPKLLKSLEVKVRSVTTVAWEERKWGQGVLIPPKQWMLRERGYEGPALLKFGVKPENINTV